MYFFILSICILILGLILVVIAFHYEKKRKIPVTNDLVFFYQKAIVANLAKELEKSFVNIYEMNAEFQKNYSERIEEIGIVSEYFFGSEFFEGILRIQQGEVQRILNKEEGKFTLLNEKLSEISQTNLQYSSLLKKLTDIAEHIDLYSKKQIQHFQFADIYSQILDNLFQILDSYQKLPHADKQSEVLLHAMILSKLKTTVEKDTLEKLMNNKVRK
jgi:hypothetical protein